MQELWAIVALACTVIITLLELDTQRLVKCSASSGTAPEHSKPTCSSNNKTTTLQNQEPFRGKQMPT